MPVILGEPQPFASRGGLKLDHALKQFHVLPCGKTAIDVGASTGGFTDCLLKNGAKKVYAVDVGYGQLVWSLRNDPRVICLDRKNARTLSKEDIGEANPPETSKKIILSALAFSFLNPHVYLDTVVLVGSLGAQYPLEQRWIFGAGAIASSWIWFFGLAYGAVIFSPLFNKASFRKLVDIIIAVIMWSIAWSLLKEPILDIIKNI